MNGHMICSEVIAYLEYQGIEQDPELLDKILILDGIEQEILHKKRKQEQGQGNK